MTWSRPRCRAPLPLLLAALLAGVLGPAGGLVSAQVQGTVPTEAGPAPHWRFQRHDPESLKQLGGGDLTAGLNKLGEVGFELFIVTSANDQGAAGWFYLRQPPWITPMPRPSLEYRALDDPQIAQLGKGNYADGLISLENDGWRLVAITLTKGGGSGWTYFMRERPATSPAAASPSVPAVGEPQAQSAAPPGAPATPPASPAPAADFSSPRSAVDTLIAVAAARDADLLSKCFAETAAKEFTPLRTRAASAKDLDDLAALFAGAAVTGDKVKANRMAVVSVRQRPGPARSTQPPRQPAVRVGAARIRSPSALPSWICPLSPIRSSVIWPS